MTETLEQWNYYGTADRQNKAEANSLKQRMWSHCPRCIGGNMHLEPTGEYLCLQCGYSAEPATVTLIPKISQKKMTATRASRRQSFTD